MIIFTSICRFENLVITLAYGRYERRKLSFITSAKRVGTLKRYIEKEWYVRSNCPLAYTILKKQLV